MEKQNNLPEVYIESDDESTNEVSQFTIPSEFSDITLLVEGKKLYTSEFREKIKKNILPDKLYDDVCEMLLYITPGNYVNHRLNNHVTGIKIVFRITWYISNNCILYVGPIFLVCVWSFWNREIYLSPLLFQT